MAAGFFSLFSVVFDYFLVVMDGTEEKLDYSPNPHEGEDIFFSLTCIDSFGIVPFSMMSSPSDLSNSLWSPIPLG